MKGKKVTIEYKEVYQYITFYTCPYCHTTFHGFVGSHVLRFVCRCGKELIAVHNKP